MKKILVMEDEDAIRENISDALSLNDYQVFIADNGVDGVHLANEMKPDLILCDIMMPKMDGYQVLEAIKSDEKGITIPFIFISAKGKHEDIRKGMNMGADDYLIKPFLFQDLLTMVSSKLEGAERKQKTYFDKQQDLIAQYGLIQMHELNTPMNGILTSVSLLQEMDLKAQSAEALELLQIINISSKRLHRSLSNILFYQQLKDGKHIFYPEIISETSIKVAIVNVSKKYNRTDDLALSIENYSIQFDRKLLLALMVELTDNAFKFSKKNDQVLVSLTKTADAIQIRIQQINSTNFEINEFANSEPFKQFNKEKYEQAGIGLGLAIVKLISEQYGVKLSYEIDQNNNAFYTLSIPQVGILQS